MVLMATTAMRRSVPASVEPGLNPNQPKARMKVPRMANGMLWGGIGLTLAVLVEFANARADEPSEDQADDAALHMHHRGAGEIHVAVAQTEVDAQAARASRRPKPSCRTPDT